MKLLKVSKKRGKLIFDIKKMDSECLKTIIGELLKFYKNQTTIGIEINLSELMRQAKEDIC